MLCDKCQKKDKRGTTTGPVDLTSPTTPYAGPPYEDGRRRCSRCGVPLPKEKR